MDPTADSTPDSNTSADSAKRPGIFKRLYLWVLHWADTPYGTPALFGISFAESSFFPIPPDVLQIALSVSKPRRSFYYATISGIASVMGAFLGWTIGYLLWSTMGGFFLDYMPGVTTENIDYVGGLYSDNAFLAIIGAAFTPIPFKVFTISAGIFHQHVSLSTLIIASALGRFSRFYLVATCIFFFGPSVKSLLDKYFEWVALLLFVLLIGGFAVIKLLL